MCLAVPLLLEEREGDLGKVSMAGGTIEVDLSLVPQAGTGDYVLVHAGFAINVYEKDEAEEVLALWDTIAQIEEQEQKS